MSNAAERMLVPKEVMSMARISRTALNNLVALGALNPVRLGDRLTRFKSSEVRALLETGIPQPATRTQPKTVTPRGKRKLARRDEV